MLINRNPQDQWQSSIAAKGLSHTGILVLPLFLYQTFKEVQLLERPHQRCSRPLKSECLVVRRLGYLLGQLTLLSILVSYDCYKSYYKLSGLNQLKYISS